MVINVLMAQLASTLPIKGASFSARLCTTPRTRIAMRSSRHDWDQLLTTDQDQMSVMLNEINFVLFFYTKGLEASNISSHAA
jgi:hypothetical protein